MGGAVKSSRTKPDGRVQRSVAPVQAAAIARRPPPRARSAVDAPPAGTGGSAGMRAQPADPLASVLARTVATRATLARAVAAPDKMRAALAKTLADGDGGDVCTFVEEHPDVLAPSVAENDKLGLLRKLNAMRWVHPRAETIMEQLWNSFGETRIMVVAKANEKLWDGCIDQGAELHAIPVLLAVRDRFQADVVEVATRHMDANLAATDRELRGLGLAQGAAPVHPGQRDLRRDEVRELMQQVAATRQAMAELRKVGVGHHLQKTADGPLIKTIALFVPGARPEEDPSKEDLTNGMREYAEIQRLWDTAQGFIELVATQSPAVYAAIAQDKAETIGAMTDPAAQLAQTGKVLAELRSKIVATRQRIVGGEIDFRSLAPIHEQLYAGAERAGSHVDWRSHVAQAVGRGVVGASESRRMWAQLGLGLLAGGAFIAAEVFTGGLATFAGAALVGGGIGIGTGVAAESWVQSHRLGSAAQAAADADHRVVTAEQARAAKWEAVLNTVFVALDVLSPAWKAGKVALQGMRAERVIAEQTLSAQWQQIAKLASDPSTAGQAAKAFELLVGAYGEARTIERLVTELGAERAMQVTGKSAEELASRLAATSEVRAQLEAAAKLGLHGKPLGAAEAAAVEEARRARRGDLAKRAGGFADPAAAREWLQAGDLESRLRGLITAIDQGVVDRAIGDQLVLEAVERFGPQRTMDLAGGWTRLSAALTNESAAAGPFLRWRQGVFDDLREFGRRELKVEIPAQGSSGKFKNDLDISLLEGVSAAHRERVAQYLAKRLGIANDPELLNYYMKIELFMDPRRLIAYDALAPQVREKVARRQAEYERDLIPNRDLYQARQHGNQRLATEIRAQMKAQGVREFDYVPLTAGQIKRLSQRLDDAHRALLDAVKTGDTAGVEKAAEELGRSQSLIDAAHDGGYFSGGAARAYVTERNPNKLMDTIVPGAARGQLPFERYTALLDQLSKLNHSADELAAATQLPDLVEVLRAVGKYGERAQEIVHLPGATLTKSGVAPEWERLLMQFKSLKSSADRGHAAARMYVDRASVIGDAQRLLDEARGSSLQALEQIRSVTGLNSVPGAADAITAQIRNHVRALQVIDGLKGSVGELARGGSAAGVGADGAAGG
jgi:hypothetical protein